MRPLVLPLVALVLLSPGWARAACRFAAGTAWPEAGQHVPANGQLVLGGFGWMAEHIERLGERDPRLVGGGEVIGLEVRTTIRGAEKWSWAVLAPRWPLQPGVRYELAIDPALEDDSLGLDVLRFLHEGQGRPGWIAAPIDTAAPRWLDSPRKAGGYYTPFGCGPDIRVGLRVRFEDPDGAVALLIDLRRKDGTGPRQHGFLELESATIRRLADGSLEIGVGRDMCGGPFEVELGVAYLVELTAVDAAGNQAPAPGGEVEVAMPTG